MAGFGSGFGSASRNRRLLSFSAAAPESFVLPAPNWDGTQASGFVSTPVDPARTTAKPACRLITPPRQWFTDELVIGVAAMANDGGTLFDNLGLEKVTVYFEGTEHDILSPSYHTFDDVNGVSRSYLGWWATLKKPASVAGFAEVYFEAVPKDGAMQNRVMGPYVFAPQDVLHDVSIAVAPSSPEVAGTSYQSLADAVAYAKGQSALNPLITFAEAGIYSGADTSGSHWNDEGYMTLEASVAGVVLGLSSYTTDAAARMSTFRYKWWLRGSNISLDFKNMVNVDTASTAGVDHVFEGVNLINSHADGREQLWRGGPPPSNNELVEGAPWFMESTFTDVNTPCVNASLVRGCHLERIAQDIFSNALCVIETTVYDHSNETWNTDIPAFSVQYSGGESTATLERSGGTEGYKSGGGGGIFTATWGGNTAIFDVGNGGEDQYTGASGDGYWFQDVVDWLNGLTDWSATMLISPDRRACTASLAGEKGQGFGGSGNNNSALDCKGVTATVVSLHDKHGDWYQHTKGKLENVVAYNCIAYQVEAQCLFLSPNKKSGQASEKDMLFFNLAFFIDPVAQDYYDPADSSSQLGRTDADTSHVVVSHCTFANQRWLLRTDNSGFDMDGYCLFSNNAAKAFIWMGGTDADMIITNNHFHFGAAVPAGSSGTIIGGDESSLFVDAANGDFAPAGPLLTNLKSSVVKYDLAGATRLANAPVGAVSA